MFKKSRIAYTFCYYLWQKPFWSRLYEIPIIKITDKQLGVGRSDISYWKYQYEKINIDIICYTEISGKKTYHYRSEFLVYQKISQIPYRIFSILKLYIYINFWFFDTEIPNFLKIRTDTDTENFCTVSYRSNIFGIP